MGNLQVSIIYSVQVHNAEISSSFVALLHLLYCAHYVLSGYKLTYHKNVATNCTDIMHLFLLDTDPCQSSPCENKGTCKKSGNSYNCACAAGYIGRQCESVCTSFT